MFILHKKHELERGGTIFNPVQHTETGDERNSLNDGKGPARLTVCMRVEVIQAGMNRLEAHRFCQEGEIEIWGLN